MNPQIAPADTVSFMLLGYAVILGSMGLYIVSLWIRFRNARRDLSLLTEIDRGKKG
jgi:hypothetical protein